MILSVLTGKVFGASSNRDECMQVPSLIHKQLSTFFIVLFFLERDACRDPPSFWEAHV
jgi:hypothetical protein